MNLEGMSVLIATREGHRHRGRTGVVLTVVHLDAEVDKALIELGDCQAFVEVCYLVLAPELEEVA